MKSCEICEGEMKKLRDCPVCSCTILKRKSESWVNYGKKNTCSIRCGAIFREQNNRTPEQQEEFGRQMLEKLNECSLRLFRAVSKWKFIDGERL